MSRRTELVPVFQVHVFGTWDDVIGFKIPSDIREQLLAQKPDTAEDAEDWRPYTITCDSALAIADAVRIFAMQNLDVAVAVHGKTGDGIATFYASTSNGYDPTEGPQANVEIDEELITGETGKAIKEAIRVLRRVDRDGDE